MQTTMATSTVLSCIKSCVHILTSEPFPQFVAVFSSFLYFVLCGQTCGTWPKLLSNSQLFSTSQLSFSNSQLKLFLKPFDLFLDIGQINFSLFFHIQKKPKTAPGWVGGGKRVFLDDIQLDLNSTRPGQRSRDLRFE